MDLLAGAERAERRKRLIILAILWVAVLVVLLAFRTVVLPFAAAGLIAYLVAPLVDRIARLRVGQWTIPRWVAILSIYLFFFLAVYLAAVTLVPQLYREVARISKDASATFSPESLDRHTAVAEQWLEDHGIPVSLSSRSLGEIENEREGEPQRWMSVDLELLVQSTLAKTSAWVKDNLGDIVAISRSIVGGVLAGVFMMFFMLMVAAFFSIDWSKIRSYCRTLVPPDYADDVRDLLARIDRSLAGVVRGQGLICLVNGLLTFVGLMIFKVKFAFLLATVATLFSLIPIFGTIISSVPIVLIAVSQGFSTGLAMLLWIVGIHALEAYFLNPKIMGSAARIHPIVVAFALIAGERTFGLLGALFAVPVAALFVAFFEHARLKAQPPDAPASDRPVSARDTPD